MKRSSLPTLLGRGLRAWPSLLCALTLGVPSAALAQVTQGILGRTAAFEGPATGTDSVVLAVSPPGATWTNTANASWLHLGAASQTGQGSGNLIFSYDANPGPTRNGTLTLGTQALSITQAGSTYIAAPAPITVLASTGLSHPLGLVADAAGNIYIADTGNRAIKEWVAASNTVTTLADSGMGAPYAVTLDGLGNLYVADAENSAVYEGVVTNFVLTLLTAAGLSNPQGVAADSAGNVYIADTADSAIKEWVVATNALSTLIASGLTAPEGVAVDVAGNLYIADTYDGVVKQWSAASNTLTTLVPAGLGLPEGVAVDGAGNVYVAENGTGAIVEWTAATGNLTMLVPSGLRYPSCVAVDAAGNVYFNEYLNQAIEELPRAFIDPSPRVEGPDAGSDVLPPVLPLSANLAGPFAPVSDQPWLTLTGTTNGVVSFSFSATTTNRVAQSRCSARPFLSCRRSDPSGRSRTSPGRL